ncbi:hypothetical protein PUN28_000201 [Cardiocondyla obscurior]|uniref:Secreted protein n=1 Tax=Cardiocondyla obscurior TaxID=286306 RepID=A0AAW2GYL8_9HYME
MGVRAAAAARLIAQSSLLLGTRRCFLNVAGLRVDYRDLLRAAWFSSCLLTLEEWPARGCIVRAQPQERRSRRYISCRKLIPLLSCHSRKFHGRRLRQVNFPETISTEMSIFAEKIFIYRLYNSKN